jgi:hypothetical protein
MTDTVAATRRPLKRCGTADGSSTLRSVASREAPMLRISRSCCGSTERSPSATFTVSGKKQISATMAIFGPIP